MRTAARTVVFHTTCMPVSEYRDDVAGRQRLAGTSFYISGDRCDKINGLPHWWHIWEAEIGSLRSMPSLSAVPPGRPGKSLKFSVRTSTLAVNTNYTKHQNKAPGCASFFCTYLTYSLSTTKSFFFRQWCPLPRNNRFTRHGRNLSRWNSVPSTSRASPN